MKPYLLFIFFSTFLFAVTAHCGSYKLKSDYPWHGILLEEEYCTSLQKKIAIGTRVIVVGGAKDKLWICHEDNRISINSSKIDELLAYSIEGILKRNTDRSFLVNFSKLATVNKLIYDSIATKELTEKPLIYSSILAELITAEETTLTLGFLGKPALFCTGDLKVTKHFSDRAEINDIHFQRGDLVLLEGEEQWIGMATGRSKEIIVLTEEPKGTICALQQPVDTFIETKYPESLPKLSVFNPIWHQKLLNSETTYYYSKNRRLRTRAHVKKLNVSSSQHSSSTSAVKKAVSLENSFESPQQGTTAPAGSPPFKSRSPVAAPSDGTPPVKRTRFEDLEGSTDNRAISVVDSTTLPGSPTRNPEASYVYMIAQAIHAQPNQQAFLKTIYAWIEENYKQTAKIKKDPKGWQNSVRHNLSLHDCFGKIQSGPKACLWFVKDYKGLMSDFGNSTAQRKRMKRHSGDKSTTSKEAAPAAECTTTHQPWWPILSNLPLQTPANIYPCVPSFQQPVMHNPLPGFSSFLQNTTGAPPLYPYRGGDNTGSRGYKVSDAHHQNDCMCSSCQERDKTNYSSGYQIHHE